MNQQPWHFTAIRNPDLLRQLEENCKSAFLESNVEALRKEIEHLRSSSVPVCNEGTQVESDEKKEDEEANN
jgi:nitroreductase